MDDELTLHELQQLEAERKLASIPEATLETAWVREAQIEAVIDAVLAVTLDDPMALLHARHVGEWSARIAMALEFGPDPSFARRVGVLSDVDPDALERIPELLRFADHVREFQTISIKETASPKTVALIVAVADQFDRVVAQFARQRGPSPLFALKKMLEGADAQTRRIVEALAESIRTKSQVVA
jgi:HD-GYP domain-containing protein (c-di-GMP phosphodiesterase class II)